jgi:hypothetical protein
MLMQLPLMPEAFLLHPDTAADPVGYCSRQCMVQDVSSQLSRQPSCLAVGSWRLLEAAPAECAALAHGPRARV